MISLKKLALLTAFAAAAFAGSASAYTMGPYLNAGAGGAFFSLPDFFGHDDDYTSSSIAGRLGLGYIAAFSQTEDPFFWGIEGNGNYYSLTNSNVTLYGGDLSGILGKQLSDAAGIYTKIGATIIGRNGDDSGFVFGPQVGVGLGYQLTQHLRLTGEGDFSVAVDAPVTITTVMVGLQYSF